MGLLPSPEVRGKEIVNVSMIYVNPPQRYAAQRGRVKIIVCPWYAGEFRQIEVKSRISLSYRG
jgi:hypothetical protein